MKRTVLASTIITPYSGDMTPLCSSPMTPIDQVIPSISGQVGNVQVGKDGYFIGQYGSLREVGNYPLQNKPGSVRWPKRMYLVRHGETEPNNQRVLQGSGLDEPLNERGKSQAKCLGEALAQLPIDAIYCSQLKRAKETAAIIREHHAHLDIEVDKQIEEICWGTWEGQRDPSMVELFSAWEQGDYEAKPPSGESPADCVRRSVPALLQMLNSDARHILIVAHGRLLRIILSYLNHESLDYMSRYRHHNTSLNLLEFDTDDEQFRYVNRTLSDSIPSSNGLNLPTYDTIATQRPTPLPKLPPHIKVKPLLLDDYSHVPPALLNT